MNVQTELVDDIDAKVSIPVYLAKTVSLPSGDENGDSVVDTCTTAETQYLYAWTNGRHRIGVSHR